MRPLPLLPLHNLVLPFRLTSPTTRTLTTTPSLNGIKSSSSKRWVVRQTNDPYTRAAKTSSYKSRAAFKLVQINETHRILRPNNIIIDLGYAPGSWTQVAVDFSSPHGKVLGVDFIPCCPPKGASTIQGNFLDAGVREQVREWIRRVVAMKSSGRLKEVQPPTDEETEGVLHVDKDAPGYIDMERSMSLAEDNLKLAQGQEAKDAETTPTTTSAKNGRNANEAVVEKVDPTKDIRHVNVILSDMCAPPEVMDPGLWNNCLAEPYSRMCNTSGIPFRDHAGSMDLCNAALRFALETLKPGGHFVCKFFMGKEDKILEKRLNQVFEKVVVMKPDASRKESKEAFFVAKNRRQVIPDWLTLEAIHY